MKDDTSFNSINLQDADLTYYPDFIKQESADNLYEVLLKNLAWEQHYIKLFGKTIAQPRLSALYASNDKSYTYSGLKLNPEPFTAELKKLNSLLQHLTGQEFTHCLVNLYRNGNDSMGWHSDNERELGKDPLIASISLGALRNFQLKHIKNPELKYNIYLEHGSLLLMQCKTQEFWKHQLPKSKKELSPRINLTFRTIL